MPRKGYRPFLKSVGPSGRSAEIDVFQKFGIFHDYLAERGDIAEADLGRINSTGREIDRYVFKVPSLRNVEVTAPYLHDGRAGTLEQAIAIMGRTQTGKTLDDQDIALIRRILQLMEQGVAIGQVKQILRQGRPLAKPPAARSDISGPWAEYQARMLDAAANYDLPALEAVYNDALGHVSKEIVGEAGAPAAALASRRNRLRAVGLAANSGARSLTATTRLSLGSWARSTTPMPP